MLVWTVHALERLDERGLTRKMVEQAVREWHPAREPNEGEADWRIDTGRSFVLYDHPDGDNMDVVRIITAWPKRGKRRRHLKSINDRTKGYPDR
jgi:hypothetical protein